MIDNRLLIAAMRWGLRYPELNLGVGVGIADGIRSIASRPYTISMSGDSATVVWNILKYASDDRAVYIHGREYNDLFDVNNVAESDGTNLIHDAAGRFVAKNARYVKLSSSTDPHVRQSRFWVDLRHPEWLLAKNEKLDQLLSNRMEAKSLIQMSPDAFLDKLNKVCEINGKRRSDVAALSDKIRRLMTNDNTLISLDGIEGSLASAILLNSANATHGFSRVILGPSKYKGVINGKSIPRPLLSERKILSIYSRVTGAGISDVSRNLEQWAVSPTNASDVRNGKSGGRFLTKKDLEKFIVYEPDVEDDIPPQIDGAISAKVVDGRLVESEPQKLSGLQLQNFRAGTEHLLNLIGDVESSSYLDNWSPGARSKLTRVKSGLDSISKSDDIDPKAATALALDGESFRHVYMSSKEELSATAQAEFSPIIAQMDLIFSQLDSWRSFKNFGSSIGWGEGFSTDYRNVLGKVAEGLSNFPSSAVDGRLREALSNAASKAESGTPIEKVEATATVRNVLSATFRYFKQLGGAARKGTISAVERESKDATRSVLKHFTFDMKDRLLDLARASPQVFGWITNLLQ